MLSNCKSLSCLHLSLLLLLQFLFGLVHFLVLVDDFLDSPFQDFEVISPCVIDDFAMAEVILKCTLV